jgi:hypothetical protein
MKNIALAALFVLGLIELSFPVGVGLIFYVFSPQTRRVFVTDEQQQLFQQLHVAINSRCQIVLYFGIATILIGIILLVADRKKKP